MFKDIVELMPGNIGIYSNKESVKRSEFYAALQAGIQTDLSFTVKVVDFNGQHELVYDGIVYNIVRTYQKTEDDIELVCQRSERNPVLHHWELNSHAILYRLVTTTEFGSVGDTQTPEIVDSAIPVKVETLSGREYTEERRKKAEVTHKVTLAYRSDLNKSMYFEYDGRKLVIEYIVDVSEAKVMLECFCHEEP